MWNKLDKVSRFALVVAAIPLPILIAQLLWAEPGYFVPTLVSDVLVVGFFWALAQGMKAVFIPRRP